jgi:drug/metabolite transporter (DMT)-like permease
VFKVLAHPYMLLTLTVLFWAGNSVVGRAFATDIPPLALVFWRWVIAACILLPICAKQFRRDLPIIRRHLPYIVFQGFLSITAFNALLYWGLHYTTVINTSLVQSSMPVVTLVFSWLILRKGVSLSAAFGIALSLLGVAWVIARGDFATLASVSFNPGDMLILAAISLWAVYTVLLAKMPAGISRLALVYAMVLSGLVLLFPFYMWEISTGAHFTLNQNSLLAFAYIGIFPSVLAFLFWNKGVEMVGANVAGSFINLSPVFSTIMGVFLLGESLEPFHYSAIALIFIGIWLVTKKNKVKP